MNTDGMRICSISENVNELSTIEGYAQSLSLETESFQDPDKALLSSQNRAYDLLIVDQATPKPDVLDFIRSFRQKSSREIPIIILMDAGTDIEIRAKALHLGAHDFLMRPLHASLFQSRVFNALKLKKAQSLLEEQSSLLEEEISNATKAVKESEHEALKMLGVTTAYKEHETSGHTLRIAHYCKVLAKASGLNEKLQDIIFHASQFYDLGKVGIPEKILLKEGKLDEEEFETVKQHARLGYDILKYTKSEYLKAGAVISYSHHEKFDGSGYPIGLIGDTIPLPGRIVAIADVFDALTSVRVYKKAWSVEDACELLIEEKGKHFDPNLVELFMENLEEIKSIKDQFPDER